MRTKRCKLTNEREDCGQMKSVDKIKIFDPFSSARKDYY